MSNQALQTATFGAGCFWGVESFFMAVPGVVETAAGYMGGHTDNPTYEEVCTDRTGHAEVVQVIYDPEKVSYNRLVEVFWKNHNPTTMNRQGPDIGTQYRSVIFYHSPEQKAVAEKSKQEMNSSGRLTSPIVTTIEVAGKFTKAEEYHQKYFQKKGIAPTCHL